MPTNPDKPFILIQPDDVAMQNITDAHGAGATVAAKAWLKSLVPWMRGNGVLVELVPQPRRIRPARGRITCRAFGVLYAMRCAVDSSGVMMPVHSALVHEALMSAHETPLTQAYLLDHPDASGTPLCGRTLPSTSALLSQMHQMGRVLDQGVAPNINVHTGRPGRGMPAHYYTLSDEGARLVAAYLAHPPEPVDTEALDIIQSRMRDIVKLCRDGIAKMVSDYYTKTPVTENLPHDD